MLCGCGTQGGHCPGFRHCSQFHRLAGLARPSFYTQLCAEKIVNKCSRCGHASFKAINLRRHAGCGQQGATAGNYTAWATCPAGFYCPNFVAADIRKITQLHKYTISQMLGKLRGRLKLLLPKLCCRCCCRGSLYIVTFRHTTGSVQGG